MSTWKERHFLCTDKHVPCSGFSPRPYHKLALQKPPHTDIKIRVCQKIRCPLEEAVLWHVWGYHTWLDVGRMPPIYRPRPDKPFDSNTWRWVTAPRKPSTAEPPVPPPSLMDGNTYVKFIEGEGLFVDCRHKKRVLRQTQKELKQCEQLKLRSECRAPPLDIWGNIIPPKESRRCVAFNSWLAGGFWELKATYLKADEVEKRGSQGKKLPHKFPSLLGVLWYLRRLPGRYRYLLSGKSLASLCVQLQPVRPPSAGCWNDPCPSLQPHYQDTAIGFVLKNSSPIYQEVVEKYQELALSGTQIQSCTPVGEINRAA